MQDIFSNLNNIAEFEATRGFNLDERLSQNQPCIIRGLVKDWPLVKAGNISSQAARDYLLAQALPRKFPVTKGHATCKGRVFYQPDMSMNITMEALVLSDIFDEMAAYEREPEQPLIYLTSIDMGKYFRDLNIQNKVDLEGRECLESIWIGLRTVTSAHSDFPNNLACVAVGKRRFTLFPPEQIENLYIGPLENTPAGRPISMVDFRDPDYVKFPKFREALKHGMTAILEPGDAIFIPSMWWHEVESLSPFNALVNYWWRPSPNFLGHPQDALFHAIWAIRDLPEIHKQQWKDLFNHYVFSPPKDMTDHIPFGDETILGPLDGHNANKIRSYLLRALNA